MYSTRVRTDVCVLHLIISLSYMKLIKKESVIEYYSGRKDLPIFVRQKKHLSTTEIVEALLDPDLDQDQICIHTYQHAKPSKRDNVTQKSGILFK